MKSGYIIVIILTVLSAAMLTSYVYEEKTEHDAPTHTTGDLLIEFEPRIPNQSQIIYSEGNGSVTIDFRRQE